MKDFARTILLGYMNARRYMEEAVMKKTQVGDIVPFRDHVPRSQFRELFQASQECLPR